MDPFAGTGSIAIEAAEVGAAVISCDLSPSMVKGSLQNMKAFRQSWLGVVRCDSRLLPVAGADAVATDIPYGRASSTMGRGVAVVLEATLSSMEAVLKSDSRMVLMHPANIEVEPGNEWAVEEDHALYVHKLLTRAITVLRRR
jgi:tRNA G10  N-methylase Trm11